MSADKAKAEEHVIDASFTDAALGTLLPRVGELKAAWASATPFPHIVVDDFFSTDVAEALLQAFPSPVEEGWDGTTYIHQRNKLTRVDGFPEPIRGFFELTASEAFRHLLSEITGIPNLLDDPDLVGGGCHQILRNGFLDVHVDFNLHPTTGWYRRLNLLVYLNKDWNEEWGGALELWDMEKKNCMRAIPPVFNRAVLFETSEISYHGHPNPLKTPDGITRKSLAVYYYTAEPPSQRVALEHNTLYRQTTGLRGYTKTSLSALAAGSARLRSSGALNLARSVASKTVRKLRGLPPENR